MKTRLAKKILRGIGIGAAVALALSNPYFGLRVARSFKRRNDKKEWRKFYESLRYLNRRGYVKIISRNDNGIKVKLTRKGEEVVKEVDIDSMVLRKPKTWDNKWRLVIFDVPNTKSKNRLSFTEKLKDLGFIMVQKSVWAYPYECYEELTVLRKFFDIERDVTYLEVSNVEDELEWRGKFNLKQRF